jgi:ParB-like chromosome segregation protein Spo0J
MDELIKAMLAKLETLSLEERIEAINQIRIAVHGISPFRNEPVDCVLWMKQDTVVANDYNPNAVAPPEMTLLEHSIREDGYTQPIVAWEHEDEFEVVDGFHRNRVGREVTDISDRVHGYLPVVVINQNRDKRTDRMAATVRHNRARGKHHVEAMSDIVQELTRSNWSNERIGKELGMEPDEVLRLKQVTGLAEMFKDHEFSKAWEPED